MRQMSIKDKRLVLIQVLKYQILDSLYIWY